MNFKIILSDNFAANLLESLGNSSTLCILGSNMPFNLNKAAERGLNQGTSYRVSSRTVSTIEFA